jgi:7-cyano-7-deazaguanine synthase in queuosine biosynthesis
MKVKTIDIDGILTIETHGFGKKYYPKRTPNKYNIDTLWDLRRRGYKIILHTARFFTDRKVTEAWLKKYKVPYDKLILGKPQAELYIDDKATNTLDREVLLLSGGVDSIIGLHYLDFPKALYIDLNHKYANKEMASLIELEKIIPKMNIEMIEGPDLSQFEVGDKAYIPYRNLMLALLASYSGNKIYLCGVKGDNVEDKNAQAFDVMSHSMNFIRKPSDPKISIESPFWNMTKTDLIKWFIDNYPMGYVLSVLKASVSCYDDSTLESCGWCASCFRKWLALEYCGIVSYDWFEHDPRNWKEIPNYVKRFKEGYYDSQRTKESEEVLRRYHLW